jgi:hypothetical protein
VLACPSGYSQMRLDGEDLCILEAYAPTELVVDPRSTDSYASLYQAMLAVSSDRTVIYLTEGEHKFTAESDNLDPLSSSGRYFFKLTAAFCSVKAVPNCLPDGAVAKVTVGHPKLSIGNYFYVFEIDSVEFSAAKVLNADCSTWYCEYCPFYATGLNRLRSDQNEYYDIALLEQGLWPNNCEDYHSYTFIHSTTVTKGSFKITNSVFKQFRHEPGSVILVKDSKVHISSSHFENIVAANAVVYLDEDCEVHIEDISVTLINNGFEMTESINQTPFLTLNRVKTTQVLNSNFYMNLVLQGGDVNDEISALIYVLQFKETLTIKGCSFKNNFSKLALIYVDVEKVDYELKGSGNRLEALTWTHFTLSDCIFELNGANMLIYYSMYFWPHNLVLSALTFKANYIFDTILLMQKFGEIETYSVQDEKKFVFAQGTKTQLVYSKQTISAKDLTFTDNSSSISIDCFKLANIELVNISSDGNGDPQMTFNQRIVRPFIESSEVYLKNWFPNIDEVKCKAHFGFYRISTVSVKGAYFHNNSCNDGSAGVTVELSSGLFTLSDSTFTGLTSNSVQGAAVFIESFSGSIEIANCLFSEGSNGEGSSGLMLNTSSEVLVKESSFINNSGESPLQLSNSAQALIYKCIFKQNKAVKANGGAVSFTTTSAKASKFYFTVSQCVFTDNSSMLGSGGVLYLTSIGQNNVAFAVESSSFVRNYSLLQGSCIHLSSSFGITSGSSISNCEFSDNEADKDAVVMLQYVYGCLVLSNNSFMRNSAGSVSSVYAIFQTNNLGLEISSSTFRQNSSLTTVLISSSEISNKLTTTNLIVSENSAIGLIIEGMYWVDTGTLIEKNPGGGVQMTRSRAELTGTKFVSNSSQSSGGGFRNNNLSSLSCNKCEFTDNSSQNNGGALMSESESMFRLVATTFSSNSARNSGAAIYIISSTEESTISDSTFLSNSAQGSGVIALLDAKLLIEGSLISKNTSNSGSPGITTNTSSLKIKGTEISQQS